jgi:hypothetical protein
MTKRPAIAPLIVAILVAAGLIGGVTAGYVFREPLKKMIKGVTTEEEIEQAIDNELAKIGQNKFELEGVVSSVDVAAKTINVKIKSSTNSIKELQLTEAPIIIADDAQIQNGNEHNLKIGDIPINSQVHVGGIIESGILTADKVLIQKEDVDEQGQGQSKKFELSGTVKVVGTTSLTVNVTAANRRANSQRGKDLEIKVTSTTVIEKEDITIALANINVGDEVEIEGVIDGNEYTAVKIEVRVSEEGETIESSPVPQITVSEASGSNSDHGNSSNSNSNRNRNNE